MFRRWTALFLFAALPSIAATADPLEGATAYQIEIIIVEGEGVSEELAPPPTDDAWRPSAAAQASLSDPQPGERALSPPRDVAEATRADAIDANSGAPSTEEQDNRILPAPPLAPAAEPRELSLRERLASHADVNILSAPIVTVFEKQEANVYVATQQIFDYLVPLGEGKFELRHTEPQELGIRLNLEVKPTEDSGAVVLSPLTIEVTSLDGREPAPGTNLDVGRPIVSARSLKTTVPLRLGEERLLAIPSGPERNAAVILRVERVEVESGVAGEEMGSTEMRPSIP